MHEGSLTIYCGAGVTIDKTGHDWSQLVLSLFPLKRLKTAPEMPTRAEAGRLAEHLRPDELSSVAVHHLRIRSAGHLKPALARILRTAMYRRAAWEAGRLSLSITLLAMLRATLGRRTSIVTTNYDTYLEQEYQELRAVIEEQGVSPFPGLRVLALDGRVLKQTPPIDPHSELNETGEYVDLQYLHGRLPEKGETSWPLVLDENRYAESAPAVAHVLEMLIGGSTLTLILGSSLQDAPLVRALSVSRSPLSSDRIAVISTQSMRGFHDDHVRHTTQEQLRRRSSELGVTPLFTDFHGQVSQVILETVYNIVEPQGERYMARLSSWWGSWSQSTGTSWDLPERLRDELEDLRVVLSQGDRATPLLTSREELRTELWVRERPEELRQLVRWAKSDDHRTAGADGKRAEIEAGSYLAAVRALCEGRPKVFEVGELEDRRAAIDAADRYTWRTFIAVPVFQAHVPVAVVTLASTLAMPKASVDRTRWTNQSVTNLLKRTGQRITAP